MSDAGMRTARAATTLNSAKNEEHKLARSVACPLCGAVKGSPCTKPSGGARHAHAERRVLIGTKPPALKRQVSRIHQTFLEYHEREGRDS
jgi:transcription elongation factor Elf1